MERTFKATVIQQPDETHGVIWVQVRRLFCQVGGYFRNIMISEAESWRLGVYDPRVGTVESTTQGLAGSRGSISSAEWLAPGRIRKRDSLRGSQWPPGLTGPSWDTCPEQRLAWQHNREKVLLVLLPQGGRSSHPGLTNAPLSTSPVMSVVLVLICVCYA